MHMHHAWHGMCHQVQRRKVARMQQVVGQKPTAQAMSYVCNACSLFMRTHNAQWWMDGSSGEKSLATRIRGCQCSHRKPAVHAVSCILLCVAT